MNKEKIAILIDSCTDVPAKEIEQYGMYVIPLKIIYTDNVYTDGVDISAEDIFSNFEKEIPKTSLPSGDEILNVLKKIKTDGYEKVLTVCISSGLSGTYNFIKLLGGEFEGLEFFAVDTKNIGIGSGMTAILAAQNLERGMSWEELKTTTEKSVNDSKIFFCVATLEYLRKGGRIGLVASLIGERFDIKPIISCNDDGVYYNVAKSMGRKRCLAKAMELAQKFAEAGKSYNIAIAHGNAKEEAEEMKNIMLEKLKNYKNIFMGQISPALVVHTGPGLIGVGIQLLT